MAQRKLADFTADQLWEEWRKDLDRIKKDTHELFSARRTFRDLGEVFRANPRLQERGGDIWEWMRVNYASYLTMRIRRETDDQGNTVNLNQLLNEMETRPEVVTRGRYFAMLNLQPPQMFLKEPNERYFTKTWMAEGAAADPVNPAEDRLDPARVTADREALQAAAEPVRDVANKQVAHRTRVDVKRLTFPEVDAAFDAIEQTLTKYYVLLHGIALLQAEPVPQFDTHEVFTFPWIEPKKHSSPETSDVG